MNLICVNSKVGLKQIKINLMTNSSCKTNTTTTTEQRLALKLGKEERLWMFRYLGDQKNASSVLSHNQNIPPLLLRLEEYSRWEKRKNVNGKNRGSCKMLSLKHGMATAVSLSTVGAYTRLSMTHEPRRGSGSWAPGEVLGSGEESTGPFRCVPRASPGFRDE